MCLYVCTCICIIENLFSLFLQTLKLFIHSYQTLQETLSHMIISMATDSSETPQEETYYTSISQVKVIHLKFNWLKMITFWLQDLKYITGKRADYPGKSWKPKKLPVIIFKLRVVTTREMCILMEEKRLCQFVMVWSVLKIEVKFLKLEAYNYFGLSVYNIIFWVKSRQVSKIMFFTF